MPNASNPRLFILPVPPVQWPSHLEPTRQPPLEIPTKVGRGPGSRVGLVIPYEDVGTANLTGEDREGELVSIACVGEEEQRLEGHVERSELGTRAERQVVRDHPLDRPDEVQLVLAPHSIALRVEGTECLRQAHAEPTLGFSQRGIVDRR